MPKQWYELEVRDDLSAHAVDCPDCHGKGLNDDISGYFIQETDQCQTCMGYGRINEFDWNVVIRVKSEGLANLVFKAVQKHYGDRVRIK